MNSVVAVQPGNARCTELKHKAENITRSYSEVFAMLKSANTSQVEAARILKTIIAPAVFLFSAANVLDKVFVFLWCFQNWFDGQ